MNEKEIGQALLKLDLGTEKTPIDRRDPTRRILTKDRRRMRWFAFATAFFWLLAVSGPCLLAWCYLKFITPRLGAYADGRRDPNLDAAGWVVLGDAVAKIALGCFITFLVAAASTIGLVLYSRRVTLRQINSNLIEISEELKALRQQRTELAQGP